MNRDDPAAEGQLSTRDVAGEGSTEPDGSTEPGADRENEFRADAEAGQGPSEQADDDGRADAIAETQLLPHDQADRFSERWHEIQSDFVDRPRESVEEADALVADLMQRLAAGFSNERARLESQWEGGDDVSTEELRVVLTRYRSFFDRLLAA